MQKLFKQLPGHTLYWEGWEEDEQAIVHTGTVGDTGETRVLSAGSSTSLTELLEKEQKAAVEAGYKEIALEEYAEFVVKLPAVQSCALPDIESTLEEILDDFLGWTGNGLCESIESDGTFVTAFCYVLEPELAVYTVKEALLEHSLLDDAILASNSGWQSEEEEDNSFTVHWPEDFEGEFSPLA